MARALCELQLELKGDPLGCSTVEAAYPNEVCLKAEDFLPKTPVRKERKRKRGVHKRVVINLESEFVKNENDSTIGVNSSINSNGIPTYPQDEKLSPSVLSSLKEDSSDKSDSFQLSTDSITDTCPINNPRMQEPSYRIGDFPRPEELATLDENYLTKRCRLGYRAKRILKLAQSIVENRFQLRELEEVCDGVRSSTYDELTQQLSGVAGFGYFTRANVLMCMGFYERIPADSETVRHLKQVFCPLTSLSVFLYYIFNLLYDSPYEKFSSPLVLFVQFHARTECTIKTVQQDVERLYAKYAPFQFLAYWYDLKPS